MSTRFSAAPSDFNGDRISDIVWRNYATGQNELWYMVGDRLHQSAALPVQIDLGWQLEGSGDFDGDGKNDLLWQHETTGANALWLMNGETLLRELHTLAIGGEAWTISGVGDLNRDGRSDVIWRNDHTGQNLAWYMNGAVPQTAVELPTVSDAAWSIGGVGDFNGDGHDDLFWHNDTTGQSALWIMQGSSKQASVDLGIIRGKDWQVQGVGDFNGDSQAQVLWRYRSSGNDQGQLEISRFNGTQLLETRAVEIADDSERLQAADWEWQASTSTTAKRESSLRLNWKPQAIAQGKSYQITWQNLDRPTAPATRSLASTTETKTDLTVKLSLYRDDQLQSHLNLAAPDRGVYQWTVPASLQPGQYRLRISRNDEDQDLGAHNHGQGCRCQHCNGQPKTLSQAAQVFDYSDLPFTVERPELQLTSLNGGETLQAGQTYTINWLSNFSESQNSIQLALYKGGQWLRNIESTAVNDGFTTWQVPSDLPTGSDYQIRISPSNGGTPSFVADFSNGRFSIQNKPELDIQLFDSHGTFSAREWQALTIAAENWEQVLSRDKDDSGYVRVAVTKAPQRMDGGSWGNAQVFALAEAYIDAAWNQRTNFRGAVDVNGVDYHNRVNWNLSAIATMSDWELIAAMMHELGHVLGADHLDHEPDNILHSRQTEEIPTFSEWTALEFEQQGYTVDRSAWSGLRWTLA